MKYTMIIIGLLFTALSSHSISHIGGGIKSNVSLFEAPVPKPLRVLFYLEGEGLQLEGGQYFTGPESGRLPGRIMTEQLALYEPSYLYPEFSGLERTEVKESLLRMGWKLSHTTIDCAIAYEESRNGLLHRIILWGNQRGIVFVGTNRGNIRRAIHTFERTLTLKKGACQWK